MSILAQKYPWSKWRKHLALCKDEELAQHLLETAVLNSDNLYVYLRKFPVVYAKPSCGGGGRGVLKVTRQEDRVRIHTTTDRFDVPLVYAYKKVRQLAGKHHYIVQQGIDLLTIEGCPIDFRALLLMPDVSWSFMGIMGKVAVKKQIVTNHCRGGSSITFTDALKESMNLGDEEIGELAIKIESLSLRIAETLRHTFPLVAELGLDIGIDSELRLWLIEANTRPQYNLFKDYPDETLYSRIDEIVRSVRKPISRRSG